MASALRTARRSSTADQRTVIGAEREALLRLRAEGAIDDDVLRTLEHELDLEERRMDA